MTDADQATRLYVSLGRLTRALRKSAGASPVGHGALSALAALLTEGPMRLGELAAYEGVSPPSMTRIVASLEGQGHLLRTPDPDDGRACFVKATASGRRLVNSGREARITELRSRLAALPDQDRVALADAILVIESLAGRDPVQR